MTKVSAFTGMDSDMLYETFLRAIEQVKTSLSDDNPTVAVVVMEGDNDDNDNDKTEFKVIGEIGCVMTLEDGRIGLVPSRKK